MKVLITGGTGFVGKEIIQLLMQKDAQIVILSRNPEAARQKLPFPFEFFGWNPTEEVPPREAFDGVDAVIHLAGEGIAEKRWSKKQKDKILNSRVVGTRNLVKAINAYCSKPLKAFVAASAIGYYPESSQDSPSTEATPLGEGFLPEVCRAWENESWQVVKTDKTTLVRIGVVLGQGGGALSKMLPIFKFGVGGPVGNGKQGLSWIHIHDLARIFVEALTNPQVEGIVNGTAPTPVSNKVFSKTLGKVLGRPAFMPAPGFALKLAMGEMSQIVLESKFVLPAKLTEAGFTFKFPQLEGALEDVCNKVQREPLKKKSSVNNS